MKVLVAEASKHGSTREIANGIAEELRAIGLDADLRDAGSVTSLDGYDAVVLGSAIYMGSWMPEAKHLVERFQRQLVALPVWLFSSGPLGADDPQPDGDPGQIPGLIEQTQARGHRVFAGKLDRAELGIGERLITKMVHAPDGDFRDWEAIQGWADEIAAELKVVNNVEDVAGSIAASHT